MFKTKIRKVGSSFVITLTAEMVAALDAKERATQCILPIQTTTA